MKRLTRKSRYFLKNICIFGLFRSVVANQGQGRHTAWRAWLRGLRHWLYAAKIRLDLRDSRTLQRYCEKIGCPNLAEQEKAYQARLRQSLTETSLDDEISSSHS